MKNTLRLAVFAAIVSCFLLPDASHGQKKSKSTFPSVITFLAADQKPSAVCTSQPTALTLELGQGIPLPRLFSNPTASSVTFIITMQGNSLFGPTHEVGRVTLDAKTGQTSSSASIHPTGLRTPVGSDHVVINVTTDKTGNEVVGQCDYRLGMNAPPGVLGKIPRRFATTRDALSYLFQVPVRMCVLEGSSLAAGKKPGETIGGKQILDLLESVNKDVWFPNAQIAFSTSIESAFPVIADPSPPGAGGCGGLGDLTAAGFGGGDGKFAENNCAAAWQQRYPGKVGIPIIFARNFCNSLSIKGGSPGPDVTLFVKSAQARSGQRGDDLCGVPRHLTGRDITNETRHPFVIMIEPNNNPNARNVLAHELGHNLLLGHGNGLDDNHDGMPAGRIGPRRYDEYCDPGWLIAPDFLVLAEDVPTRFVNCEQSGSLMQESAGCPNLQPLQVETARDVARLMPGFVNTTPQPLLFPRAFLFRELLDWPRSSFLVPRWRACVEDRGLAARRGSDFCG
ncbi:MAG TPA: hypothetical protein VHE60_12210 [Pyrinomonadaceae bacterium]|nr:hypothetical protein [Pyrinomonadaceae bacterium]